MNKILVATHRHGLLPYAWRLRREGYDVETLVWKDRYEEAWSGMFPKALKGKEKNRENLLVLGDLARNGEFAVMVDSPRGREIFEGATQLFSQIRLSPNDAMPQSPLAVGGWFNGEDIVPHLAHVLVKDLGLLTGGLGVPGMVGGATLIKLGCFSEAAQFQLWEYLTTYVDEMKSAGFKGLFSVDLAAGDDGEILAGTLVGGWQPVHTHAFVSDLTSLGSLMEGSPSPTMASNYVVVIPVTVPPFPVNCEVKSVEERVLGLDNADMKQIFFHDFKTLGDAHVYVGGLDGLLAVVRGSGHNFLQAHVDAYRVAGKINVTGKQMRLDVGERVPSAMATLETTLS